MRVSVADLAREAGIAERTFYRWFDTKEQALRPVFDWGTDQYAVMLADTSASIVESAEAAFERVLWGDLEPRTRGLFPLVFAEASAQSVFFLAVHDGEHRIVAPLAERLGTGPGDLTPRAVAAAVSASLRIALEDMARTGEDPRPLHARTLRAFGLGAL